MTTGYQQFPITEPFNTSHPKLLSNDKNALTNNADTAFPTGTLFDGMSCYRTDENAIYLRVGNAWKQWALFTDLPLKETVSNTRYVRTDAVNQSIAGSKTFSSALTVNANVVSATVPTAVNHLTNKKYVDDGLATKQPKGDYATNTALKNGLATKQPTGDYATNTALTNGLAGKAASTHSHPSSQITDWSAKLAPYINVNVQSFNDGQKAQARANIGAVSLVDALPTGTCICGLYTTIPEGFLSMDGSKIMLSDYPNLVRLLWNFAAFRGDGSTHAYLPNMHHRFFEGTTTLSEVGTYVEAGLPNITGKFNTGAGGLWNPVAFVSIGGAFNGWASNGAGRADPWTANTACSNGMSFVASRSNNKYGISSTVQPQSTRLLCLVRT